MFDKFNKKEGPFAGFAGYSGGAQGLPLGSSSSALYDFTSAYFTVSRSISNSSNSFKILPNSYSRFKK